MTSCSSVSWIRTVSPSPDIDTDFDDDGRGEVLRWVTEKYGAERVAHIITYGTMAAKSAIKRCRPGTEITVIRIEPVSQIGSG